MSDVAKRYAQALFDVAKSRSHIDDVEDDLTAIVSVFENEDYFSLLQRRHMKNEDKQRLVDAFSETVTAESSNLLKVLIDQSREKELKDVVNAYITMANEARGIAEATVTTAEPLNQDETAQLARQFGKALNKTLRMQTRVDANVVGGVVLRIGNRVYDGSITGKLARFKQRLTDSKVRGQG